MSHKNFHILLLHLKKASKMKTDFYNNYTYTRIKRLFGIEVFSGNLPNRKVEREREDSVSFL